MIRTELSLRLPNSPGSLAGICRLLSDEHINLEAISLESSGRLHIIVDNPVKASGVLAAHHHQVSQQDVLLVGTGNRHGSLAPVLALMSAAGVNVNYAYGAGVDGNESAAVVVIGVDDAMRASTAVGT